MLFFNPSLIVSAIFDSLTVLVLNDFHTKGRYKGIIMIDTDIAGDDSLIIISIDIASVETINTENYKLLN